jgi:hypothetical protein
MGALAMLNLQEVMRKLSAEARLASSREGVQGRVAVARGGIRNARLNYAMIPSKAQSLL